MIAAAVVTPTTTDRPLWIAPELWFRMSWSARMRAVRRAMHVVPAPRTDTGAVSAPTADASAEPSAGPAPVSLAVVRPSIAVGAVIADAARVAAPTAPTWRQAARSNHAALAYMVTVYGNHVTHPVAGVDVKHRRKSRAYRPVTP